MTTLGILSDTHGHLPPEAGRLLSACDRLIHAGDVGPGVLEDLELLGKPITVVAGNTDPRDARLPLEARVRVEGLEILVRHIQPPPDRLSPREIHEIRAAGVDLLIFGHTHRPLNQSRGGVLFLNPGSAGQPRYGLRASVGKLELGGGEPSFTLLELSDSE